MGISEKAKEIYNKISQEGIKLGDLRKVAKDIKKDHELGLELWSTGEVYPRLLSVLIMDKKLITNDFVEQIDQDLKIHNDEDRLHLVDWFMTHQLLKDKKNIALVEEWQNDDSPMKRRIFWYYQA